MVKDDLGTRMKEFYEQIPKTKLMRRTPVALRLDGRSFHTFSRGFRKPFDPILMKSMQMTMKYLCENIQGCVFGYTQSDEITLILIDYQTLTTSAWFDYEVQKMCSIAASTATLAFNREFHSLVNDYVYVLMNENRYKEEDTYVRTLRNAEYRGAMFDCRAFNIPKEEVTNLVYWRQLDAMRNSIQMVGRTYFSAKELEKASRTDIQNMLYEKHRINWNDFPIAQKRGTACYKKDSYWFIDYTMPILKGENREYVDKLIVCPD